MTAPSIIVVLKFTLSTNVKLFLQIGCVSVNVLFLSKHGGKLNFTNYTSKYKTLNYFKAIFPVNPVNSQFCGYTKHFCPLKNRFF